MVAGIKHVGFEQREIDVGRAFRRATFTGEAIAERGIEFGRFQRIVTTAAQFERSPDDVGATAGGHDFVVRRHERRAHNAGLFETTATTVALLEIADERAVLEREREARLERQLERLREIMAEMIVDLVGEAENFSWIENIFWIECALDLAHDIEQRVAKLIAHVLGARDADSVLGRN